VFIPVEFSLKKTAKSFPKTFYIFKKKKTKELIVHARPTDKEINADN
jgi:hypothetical protein